MESGGSGSQYGDSSQLHDEGEPSRVQVEFDVGVCIKIDWNPDVIDRLGNKVLRIVECYALYMSHH